MKTIKILFAVMLTVSIGMGVSAFKHSEKLTATETTVVDNWYEFTGDVTEIDEVQDASFYEYRSVAPSCNSTTYICAVKAPGPTGNNDHPNAFSSQLKIDLKNAFDNEAPTLKILMKD